MALPVGAIFISSRHVVAVKGASDQQSCCSCPSRSSAPRASGGLGCAAPQGFCLAGWRQAIRCNLDGAWPARQDHAGKYAGTSRNAQPDHAVRVRTVRKHDRCVISPFSERAHEDWLPRLGTPLIAADLCQASSSSAVRVNCPAGCPPSHFGDDAGVALRAARLRVRSADAVGHTLGDRGRDSCDRS